MRIDKNSRPHGATASKRALLRGVLGALDRNFESRTSDRRAKQNGASELRTNKIEVHCLSNQQCVERTLFNQRVFSEVLYFRKVFGGSQW